jgi:hypothetical protein
MNEKINMVANVFLNSHKYLNTYFHNFGCVCEVIYVNKGIYYENSFMIKKELDTFLNKDKRTLQKSKN